MRATWSLVFITLLVVSPAQVAAKDEGIFGFVEDVFQFLCNRCKDLLSTIDNIIETEPFKKEADGICRTFILEPTLQSICINVVDTILGGLYDNLRKLEPNPEVCTSLRLCLECGIPSDIFNVPTSEPINRAYPTLPADLFGGGNTYKESPFKRIKRASEDEIGLSALRNRNDSEPFDPIEFYGKVAELATTIARFKRLAEDGH